MELKSGEHTKVEYVNYPYGSITVTKRDVEDDALLSGAKFILYNAAMREIGSYVTNTSGQIPVPDLEEGIYYLQESEAPEGYVLDSEIQEINLSWGEKYELTLTNEKEKGRIQITKVSGGYNDITKENSGALLAGAEFEVYDEEMNLMETLVTDKNGVATTDSLVLGVYGIKEVKPADYYFIDSDSEIFHVELIKHDDLVKVKVMNTPVILETSIKIKGNVEALGGDTIYYDLSDMENLSNVALEDFYWHTLLPTESVRLETIWTGIWNEKADMEVQVKTNLNTEYTTIAKGLSSTVNNEVDCSATALGLAQNEYVTDFKIVFGTAEPGFACTTGPKIAVKVLNNAGQSTFTMKVDIGGGYLDEWVYATDGWTTAGYGKSVALPKTGR